MPKTSAHPPPLATYLREARNTHATGMGQPETSYYPALKDLLDAVGAQLKPRVRCLLQLANTGAGSPDIGLFTPDQIQRNGPSPLVRGLAPSRGVVEVKKAKDDTFLTAKGRQVTKYWGHYGQVLVTNLHDFLLVGIDVNGNSVKLEQYHLSASEDDFWNADPEAIVAAHGVAFEEFLKRVMQYQAVIESPRDVAWFLASYARDARIRIEGVRLPALSDLRAALEQGLGLTFEGEKGEHFFRSTLVQTLFYGMFSAWLLWQRKKLAGTAKKFDWRAAAWELKVPMVQALFHQLTDPTKLGPLGLEEVLDWGAAALERVNYAAFSARFEAAHAVQYFYEPFLEAFDPSLRKELGVWYTPPEIVEYMVARVDAVLRDELGLADGLADSNVYVLDPAVGTGSYLVETLRVVYAAAKARYGDSIAAQFAKKAAIERIFGFEILPAPFVVAHLQLGLLLQQLGAPLAERNGERAGVYLTNSLTGWDPAQGAKQHLMFPAIEDERDAANKVKREAPILVILGNPPYNGFAGVSTEEEGGLVEPYKQGLDKWGINKNYLDDLYVRFFRIAGRRIAEGMKRGILCYISNHSYLEDPSYVVMRERLLDGFSKVWVDGMNGDSRETGKTTPEGKPDPSVFSTGFNKEGIRVGTAIALWVCTGAATANPEVRFRQFWGVNKRKDVLDSLKATPFGDNYEVVVPKQSNWYTLRPWAVAPEWEQWPQVTELSAVKPMLGLNENRGGSLFDMDKTALATRMKMYFDPTIPFGDPKLPHGLARNAARFDAKQIRGYLVEGVKIAYSDDNIVRFWFKPFDFRWAYIEPAAKLWNEGRAELRTHADADGEFLLIRRRAPGARDGAAFLYSRHLADQHALDTDAYFIPLRLSPTAGHFKIAAQTHFLDLDDTGPKPNLSDLAKNYLRTLGVADPEEQQFADLLWMHVLACGYAPAYVAENSSGLKTDWPRVPLPGTLDELKDSAALGRCVRDLLDVERAVVGVTAGTLREELKLLGRLEVEGAAKTPDLDVRAAWGYVGQRGAVMPGAQEPIFRDYTKDELAALGNGAAALGVPTGTLLDCLGWATCDVPLNESTFWSNVPERVWAYAIGGHQVLKKWLSYRAHAVLGRSLTLGEQLEVLQMTRRIAALTLLEPQLDRNYAAAKVQYVTAGAP